MQIDQSGKVEDTSKHTVLALADADKEFVVLIPGHVKRQLQEMFRRTGKPRIFVFKVFAIGIYLLLKHYPHKLFRVVIDIEYWGHEKQITRLMTSFAKRDKFKLPEIVWDRIGKGVPADLIAGQVARKRRRADKIITFEEIAKYAL